MKKIVDAKEITRMNISRVTKFHTCIQIRSAWIQAWFASWFVIELSHHVDEMLVYKINSVTKFSNEPQFKCILKWNTSRKSGYYINDAFEVRHVTK